MSEPRGDNRLVYNGPSVELSPAGREWEFAPFSGPPREPAEDMPPDAKSPWTDSKGQKWYRMVEWIPLFEDDDEFEDDEPDEPHIVGG